MPLVFSLPFCLLLPDGDYPVRMEDGEVDDIHLTKIIPKVYDERLPYRGFLKGELDKIKYLWINGKKIEAEDLANYSEFGIVTKYIDKEENEIVPQIAGNEVSISEPELMNKAAKLKLSRLGEKPDEWEDEYTSGEHYHGRQLVVNAEVKKDSFGRFRYSKVQFTSSKTGNMDERFVRAIKAVNRLIDVYRVETLDHWISNITENDIFIYKSVSETDTQMAYSMKGFTRLKKDKNPETVDQIKIKLMNPEPQDPFTMLMLFHR